MPLYIQKRGEIIPQDTRNKISIRYHAVTKAINREFRSLIDDKTYSLYVGSYGRGTAIKTSDLDILVELPATEYNKYDAAKGNGQSRLLQAVRNALQTTYPKSKISADGQIVKIDFSDNILFEILPAFKNNDGTYVYADTNYGGRWLSTNPKAEQNAMYLKNRVSNGLLFDTCKHIRSIRDSHFPNDHLAGIVIDSFVYSAINYWHWCAPGEYSPHPLGTYENHLYQQFKSLSSSIFNNMYAPGSNQLVDFSDSFDCLNKVLYSMAY